MKWAPTNLLSSKTGMKRLFHLVQIFKKNMKGRQSKVNKSNLYLMVLKYRIPSLFFILHYSSFLTLQVINSNCDISNGSRNPGQNTRQ